MIQPAHRTDTIKEYYFSRKLKEVAAMRREGIDVISLGIGGPDQAPPQEAVEEACRAMREPDAHGYQQHIGLPELRGAFARWYDRTYGVSLDPESEILPLIGSKEGVLHLSLTFLNPGDAVLVPDPGYPTYTSVSRLLGAEVITYPLKQENGWQPDFDALERTDLSRVRMMWLNYPNMPTGASATEETFRRAVSFARRHNILLAHDNPYSLILNPRPRSILSIEGAREVAVEMNSLSKSHNMPGWRVGMAASNPTFIQWMLKVKSNIDSGQFRPVMLAAARALDEGAAWQQRLDALYSTRRRVAEEIMRALGCSFDPSQTGLFLWGRIERPGTTSEQLADSILRDAHVFITPGSVFGPNGEGYIRLSLCAPEERLREALKRIKDCRE